ncbi:MAG: right-handed parallel beta-helix repeat-containing protein, partial [Ktedonobacterales bacterium]
MRKTLYALAVLVPIAAIAAAATIGFGVLNIRGAHAGARPTLHRGAVTCTPTGFIRDGINLTAAIINPHATVSGVVDATSCNIGVYYGTGSGMVLNAEIFGANYFGVVNNGASVTVSQSNIHDIGEMPLNGDQHGVAVYWAFASGATGAVTNNLIYRYQKGGIVISGAPDSATVSGNEVLGLGPVNFIAQNGIEIGGGAAATVTGNVVTGNSYTGANFASSGGILVYGGSCYGVPLTINTQVANNTTVANDVGVWISDIDVDPNNPNNCIPTTTPTNVAVTNDSAVD